VNFENKLNPFEISRHLQSADVTEIIVRQELESTNTCAMAMLNNLQGKAPFALLTNCQSCGHGRLGRKWFSAEGASVCMSVAVEIGKDIKNIESFTVRAGVEICEALRRKLFADVFLKWPNDIYSSSGKKIGGMLAEMKLGDSHDSAHTIVFGIGVNYDFSAVKSNIMPSEISQIATDLKGVSDSLFSINKLAAVLIDAIVDASKNMEDASLSSRFAKFDWLFDRPVNFNIASKTLSGVAKGIDSCGHLILETFDGTRECLNSGEATTRPPENQ